MRVRENEKIYLEVIEAISQIDVVDEKLIDLIENPSLTSNELQQYKSLQPFLSNENLEVQRIARLTICTIIILSNGMDGAAEAMIECLLKDKAVLDLEGCVQFHKVNSLAWRAICLSIQYLNVTSLKLGFGFWGIEGPNVLAGTEVHGQIFKRALLQSKVTSLDWTLNFLSVLEWDKFIEYIGGPENTKITSLVLNSNKLYDRDLKQWSNFCASLKKLKFKTLDLSYNSLYQLDADQWQEFSLAIKDNYFITELSLKENFSFEVPTEIAEYLNRNQINSLPKDMALEISKHLSPGDIVSAMRANSAMHALFKPVLELNIQSYAEKLLLAVKKFDHETAKAMVKKMPFLVFIEVPDPVNPKNKISPLKESFRSHYSNIWSVFLDEMKSQVYLDKFTFHLNEPRYHVKFWPAYTEYQKFKLEARARECELRASMSLLQMKH